MTNSESTDPVFLGIDLGGGVLKGAVVTATGEVIQEIRQDLERENSDALFKQLVEAVRSLRADKRAGNRVAAVGVGIPGLVNRKTNRVEATPNLPSLAQLNLTTDLARQTDLPVILDNDANAAAYGELHAGVAQGR